MTSDVNQINDQECRHYGDQAEGKHIADILTGDAGTRAQSRNRLRLVRTYPPIGGFLVFRGVRVGAQ